MIFLQEMIVDVLRRASRPTTALSKPQMGSLDGNRRIQTQRAPVN